MTENTISINQNETVTGEALENTAVQGEEMQQYYEERESLDAEQTEEPAGEKTDLSDGDRVELTVYGQQVMVTKEEARAAAQKGFAFEELKSRLASAQNNSHLKALDMVSGISGRTVEELISDMGYNALRADIEREYGDLSDAPQEVVLNMFEKHSELRETLKAARKQRAEQPWQNQLREFIADNPGCTEIPGEVLEDAKRTGSLLLSYTKHLADSLKEQLDRANKELETLKGQAEAAKRATPKAESVAAAGNSREEDFRKLMRSLW